MCKAMMPMVPSSLLLIGQPRPAGSIRRKLANTMMATAPSSYMPIFRYFMCLYDRVFSYCIFNPSLGERERVGDIPIGTSLTLFERDCKGQLHTSISLALLTIFAYRCKMHIDA